MMNEGSYQNSSILPTTATSAADSSTNASSSDTPTPSSSIVKIISLGAIMTLLAGTSLFLNKGFAMKTFAGSIVEDSAAGRVSIFPVYEFSVDKDTPNELVLAESSTMKLGYFLLKFGLGDENPDEGCSVFYPEERKGKSTPYRKLCLTGSDKMQTITFNYEDIYLDKMSSVFTGDHVYITLFNSKGDPHVSIGPNKEFYLSKYQFSKLQLLYVKKPYKTTSDYTITSVIGVPLTPAPCTSLCGSRPDKFHFTPCLTFCSSSDNSISEDYDSLLKMGINVVKDFSKGFSYIETGLLSEVTIYSNKERNDGKLTIPKGATYDLTDYKFTETTGDSPVERSWNDFVKAFTVSVVDTTKA